MINGVPKSYADAVQELARTHGESDPTIEAIWAFPDPDARVVRLVEVSQEELPAENGSVHAVRFGKSADFPFASEIALLSHQDWERILAGTLVLPEGWDMSAHTRVWPND